MQAILTEDDLYRWTGYKDRASLRAWLARNNIQYITGIRGRICTSLNACNKVLNVSDNDDGGKAGMGPVEIL